MKLWAQLIWVTQFGFSALFPLCFFLLLGAWLQNTYALGTWVTALCGILGLLTSIRTVRFCYRAMRRDAQAAASREEKPLAFNEHE